MEKAWQSRPLADGEQVEVGQIVEVLARATGAKFTAVVLAIFNNIEAMSVQADDFDGPITVFFRSVGDWEDYLLSGVVC